MTTTKAPHPECVAWFRSTWGGRDLTEAEAVKYSTVGRSCYWCLCAKADGGLFDDPTPRCGGCGDRKPCECRRERPAGLSGKEPSWTR